MAAFRDRMVALVANSLIDSIIGSQNEDSTLKALSLDEIDLHFDHKSLVDLVQERLGESTVHNATEIIQDAKIKAFEIFPQRLAEHAVVEDSPKPNAGSVFLIQLNAGGGSLLDTFVTWDMIREQESTNEEKIDRLAKIQYVDDILDDWATGIRPFLAEFETLQVCKLYKDWFGKARSTGTTDSHSLQRDLADQLFDVGLSKSSTLEVSQVALTSAVEMFIDLVNRSIPECISIGKRLWQTILSNHLDSMDVIVQTDPYATSVGLWLSTDEMTIDRILKLISGDSLKAPNETADINTLLEHALAKQLAPNDHLYFRLSVLRSIMNWTRVYKFPWEWIGRRNLADVLLLFLRGAACTVDARRIAICVDAVDILDRGMIEPADRRKIVHQCRDEINRLQERCDEMDASEHRETISCLLGRFS